MNEHNILSQINDTLKEATPDNLQVIKDKIQKIEEEKRIVIAKVLTKRMRFALACLIIILAGGVTVFANTMTGGDFFHMFYTKENSQNAEDQVYMGLEEYKEISSSTIGIVVDTNEIAIEVLGAVATGNVASVMLRVTAKELDTVLLNNGVLPQGNYCFNDNTGGSLFEDYENASYRYYYSLEEVDLQPNQFDILYTVARKETITGNQFTIELNKFGYFSKEKGFDVLYDNHWNVVISFDSIADYTKSFNYNKEVILDNHSFTMKQIAITPFSCSIELEGILPEDSDIGNIVSQLDELNDKLTLYFNEDTILDNNAFSHSALGGRADKNGVLSEEGMVYCHSYIMFDKPVLVEKITAIVFHDEKFDMNNTDNTK
ncbi:MAG: hypothetical protein K0S47_549 [Herbinix sp.]|jgi:hypothetical protein|nr:hypothetical protein [Herbinix sp.]